MWSEPAELAMGAFGYGPGGRCRIPTGNAIVSWGEKEEHCMLGWNVYRFSTPRAFLKGCARVFDLFGVLSDDEQVPASARMAARIGQRATVGSRKAAGSNRIGDVWIVLKPQPGSERAKTP